MRPELVSTTTRIDAAQGRSGLHVNVLWALATEAASNWQLAFGQKKPTPPPGAAVPHEHEKTNLPRRHRNTENSPGSEKQPRIGRTTQDRKSNALPPMNRI